MRRAALAAVLLGLAACGSSGGGNCGAADGSAADGGAADGDAAADGGWRAFDVTATMTLTPSSDEAGSWLSFPTAVKLTVAVNPQTGAVTSGGRNGFGWSSLSPAADGGFESTSWNANVDFSDGCGGVASISLDRVTFTIDGETLRGTATGTARYTTSGAMVLMTNLTATLVGVPDVTPPTLSVPEGDVDPLVRLSLVASEPLPDTASASLEGAPGGDVVPLSDLEISNQSRAAYAFSVSPNELRYGETYTLQADELTDFAGHALGAPISFKTRAAPPLVPEDGFESVTGTMFAGAGVLRGGPLMPISGQTSLMLNTGFGGGFGFLPYDLGPSVAVRLAVSPGDTVVRFAFQLIAPDPVDQATFDGPVLVGTPGGMVGPSRELSATSFTRTTLPSLGDIFLSPVSTVEMPLPAGSSGEITFEIVGRTFACMRPPSPTVLVIDDLRVE